MCKASSQTGLGKVGALLLICFAGVVVYFGSQIATFFYSYWEIEGLMEFQAKKAQALTDKDIRINILTRIKELKIPFEDPDDLKINRVNGEISIHFSYDEVLYVEFRGRSYDLYVFHFNPSITAPY